MNNREAITLLRNLEDSLDSYCELNEKGKTAFRMAIEALNCSEIPNDSDTISRQAAIDALENTKRGGKMKVLIACEESQRVCIAFRERGHEAYSCDILECSGGHPEWHIKGDVIPLLNGNCTFTTADTHTHTQDGQWDMIIAFPPCTHLAVSGAAWFEKKRADGRQREGIELFCKFFEADCDKVVIENPIGIISGNYIKAHFPDLAEKYGLPKKPTQIIHPWMFGDNYNKSTCLWEKGVSPLAPEVTEQPELEWFEWTDGKTGKQKRQPKWFADAWHLPPNERAMIRSKTFPGIAKAMAEQWG